jgi:hypothetical protein
MLSMSNAIGAMPATLRSVAPESHVVHPRLEAPVTMNRSRRVPSREAEYSSSAFIADATLFTIGKRIGQLGSPVRMNSVKEKAMRASSTRPPKRG